MKEGGFRTAPRPVEGEKVRSARGEKFFDHFSQARMFFLSQTEPEQQHIVEAFQFELGKLTVPAIRERMLGILKLVHPPLAARVAEDLGVKKIPEIKGFVNMGFPAGVDPAQWQPLPIDESMAPSSALSMTHLPSDASKTRQVAILFGDGADGATLSRLQAALEKAGASGRLVGRRLGPIETTTGPVDPEFSLFTTNSVLFDAVFVAGGEAGLEDEGAALTFALDAFRHYKPVGASGNGRAVLDRAGVLGAKPHPKAGPGADPFAGVVVGNGARAIDDFVAALKQGRHWARGLKPPVNA